MDNQNYEEYEEYEVEEETPKKNVCALVGFILSLSLGGVGVLLTIGITLIFSNFAWLFLPIFCYIPSLVLGIIGFVKAKKREGVGKKKSVFAIVFSIVFYVLSLGISLIPLLISAVIFIVYLISSLLTTL